MGGKEFTALLIGVGVPWLVGAYHIIAWFLGGVLS